MKITNILKKGWIATLGLLLPAFAFAQMGINEIQGYEGSNQRDLPTAIMVIVNYVLIIVGVLALAFLVYGGFLYITSHGDTQQVDKAKTTIINAVIGIVVIGIAAALVNFVVGAVSQ
ncbi:MAG: pilin [bacterium]|nr:pilin [bacterium]